MNEADSSPPGLNRQLGASSHTHLQTWVALLPRAYSATRSDPRTPWTGLPAASGAPARASPPCRRTPAEDEAERTGSGSDSAKAMEIEMKMERSPCLAWATSEEGETKMGQTRFDPEGGERWSPGGIGVDP